VSAITTPSQFGTFGINPAATVSTNAFSGSRW
jgi:hypothetical protein